jgi:hypothetical protein
MQYLHPDYRFLDDAELAKYESRRKDQPMDG